MKSTSASCSTATCGAFRRADKVTARDHQPRNGRRLFGHNRPKQAEEAHELLAGEMSHRVKNLLTIVMALTVMTSRSTQTTTEMANELTERLNSLGRAHDLVRLTHLAKRSLYGIEEPFNGVTCLKARGQPREPSD